MKILVVGATGAIGSRLVPMLVDGGHTVVGTTTSRDKLAAIARLGATGAVMNILDAAAVRATVRDAAPDVVVHQATSLSTMGGNLRRFDADFAATNRLRTEGVDNLLAAVRQYGVGRFIAQSFAGWPNARTGGMVKTEDDALDPTPPAQARQTLRAIDYLERTVTGAGGLALRYGPFYGPGTSLCPGGVHADLIRKRRFPIVGKGRGVWSFIHIDDAASATLAAIDRGDPGRYNIVDSDPAPVSQWLPYLATVVGGRRPMSVPAWIGRLAAGEFGVAMMDEIRGCSNEKARTLLGWQPAYPSWRDGFAAVFGASAGGGAAVTGSGDRAR